MSALREIKTQKKEVSLAEQVKNASKYALLVTIALFGGTLIWTILCLSIGVALHRDFMTNYRTFAKDAVYVPLAKILNDTIYILSVYTVITSTILSPTFLTESGITSENQPLLHLLLV